MKMNAVKIAGFLAVLLAVLLVAQANYCRYRYCARGYYLNKHTCHCERRCRYTKCFYGKHLDWSTCKCVCPYKKCPYGQVQNKWCKCVCPYKKCPYGQVQNKWCKCVCPYKKCPYGQVLNKWCKCEHVCYNPCPYGKVHDKWCQCVCPTTHYRCKHNQYYDPYSCKCQYRHDYDGYGK